MADNLSPLVNLDLINKIYRTINAQIAERVYDPQYNPGVALGGESSRYSNAYLQALNVQGDATISGTTTVSGKVISTGGFKGNLIAIDCGCAVVPNTMEQQVLGLLGGRLGCMRLDDMIRFYSHDHPKDYFSAATIKPNPRLIERIKKKFPIIISSDD